MKNSLNLTLQNNHTFSIAEIVYILYFSVMTLAKGLGLYDGMELYTLSLYAGAVLIIAKLILTEHTVAEWLYVLGMLALGILIYHNSDQTGAFIYITMIIGLKNVSVKRLFSIGLAIWGSTFTLLTLLTITGLKSDIFMVHEKLGLGHIIRWSLGQPHPNVLQITSLMICAMILYLANLKGKKLIFTTLIMFAANIYVFFYSISYTGLILVVFCLAANLYLSFRKELTGLEKILLNLVFPSCVAFAVLGPLTHPSKFWFLCNKVLNTRFEIAMYHMTLDPITLFGSLPLDPMAIRFANIDNSYVFTLMYYGLVLFALMCIGYMAYIYYCTKQNKYRELAITLGLAVAAIAEPFFVNPSFKNISLLFVGEFVFMKFEEFAQKKPDLLLNKKFKLCSLGTKEVHLPLDILTAFFQHYCKCSKKYCKQILSIGLCTAILVGTVFAVFVNVPNRYYVLRTSAQIVEKDYILLDINNLPDDFDGKILNYKDAETPMQMFEGNISTMEYARGIVSSGLWSGIFIALLFSIILSVKYKIPKDE